MIIPKNKKNVPNHQPDNLSVCLSLISLIYTCVHLLHLSIYPSIHPSIHIPNSSTHRICDWVNGPWSQDSQIWTKPLAAHIGYHTGSSLQRVSKVVANSTSTDLQTPPFSQRANKKTYFSGP